MDSVSDLEIWKDGCLMIVFGILLPSFDVYSDIAFSYDLISGTYKPWHGKAKQHRVYGSVMLIPIALATLFVIPHWLKRENTLKKRLLTFPLLIGQFWPQWQVIKVLRLMKKRNPQWRIEKEKLEKEVSSLGKTRVFTINTKTKADILCNL